MPFGEESTRAFIADYYKLQWERIVHHEDQRIRFSSMIAAASVAGIGIIVKFTSETNLGNLIVACVVLSAANILAIIFCRKSRRWIKYHQNDFSITFYLFEPPFKGQIIWSQSVLYSEFPLYSV